MAIQEKAASGELAAENLSTNGTGAQGNYITEYADLAGGNLQTAEQIARAQRVSADTISALLEKAASFEGDAYRETIADIKQFAGRVPEAERDEIKSALYKYKIVVTGEEADGWIRSIPSQPKSFAFEPLSLAGLYALPPKQWLIDQVIGQGDIGMIYGAPGSGKTFATIDLIFSALQGEQWAGFADILRPLTVAYAAGEGAGGLRARFEAAAEAHGITPEQAGGLSIFLDVPQIFTPKGRYGEPEMQPDSAHNFAEQYKQARGEQKLDLLILDTLHSASAGAEENSARDTGEIIKNARLLAKELGTAVCLIHHTNKAGSSERGSSAFRGAMDFMIEVSEYGSRRQIKCAKLKDGEPFKPQQFSLVAKGESVYCFWDGEATQEDGRKSDTAERLLEVLSEEPERWLTAKLLGESVGISQQAAYKALAKLADSGMIERDKKVIYGRDTLHYKISAAGLESLE